MLVFAQILVVRCLHSCHFIQNSTDHTVSVCVSKWELLHIKLKTQHNIQPDKDASRKRTRLPSNSSYGSAQAGCKSDTACLRQALPCKFNEGVREKKKTKQLTAQWRVWLYSSSEVSGVSAYPDGMGQHPELMQMVNNSVCDISTGCQAHFFPVSQQGWPAKCIQYTVSIDNIAKGPVCWRPSMLPSCRLFWFFFNFFFWCVCPRARVCVCVCVCFTKVISWTVSHSQSYIKLAQ